jgi:hypothetical protein
MKDIELTDNEIYFLACQMQKSWMEHNNKYAKSIYDKANVLLDKTIEKINSQEDFKREYECHWIKNIESDKIKLDDKVKIIDTQSPYYNEIGKVVGIDDLTDSFKTFIGIEFFNDEILHKDYYENQKANNFMISKPHIMFFWKENVELLSNL